jgi:hypothetical protein
VRSPYLLRLPFWMAERFDLAMLLAQRTELSGSQARRWLEVYALSGPETVFARGVLTRKRNLWLYRCHQRRFCGDFVVVDMSAPVDLRAAWVLELKLGEPLRFDVGGVQLQQAAEAVAEVLGPRAGWRTLLGGGSEIQAWLTAGARVGSD